MHPKARLSSLSASEKLKLSCRSGIRDTEHSVGEMAGPRPSNKPYAKMAVGLQPPESAGSHGW